MLSTSEEMSTDTVCNLGPDLGQIWAALGSTKGTATECFQFLPGGEPVVDLDVEISIQYQVF
jgi:hypothetical protein